MYEKVLERLIPEGRWCLRLWPHPGEKPALPEFRGAADSVAGQSSLCPPTLPWAVGQGQPCP